MVSGVRNRRKSAELHQRAAAVIPGGVNSPVRAFKAVGEPPLFIRHASGCRLWDVDGNEFVDYIGSWGPMIVGHSHPEVLLAVKSAVDEGTSYGISCAPEVELAEEVIRRIPSIEMIRFVNSGTEAAMSAVRLARAFTGRTKVVKFAGCYHGHADCFLVAAGSGAATLGEPDSAGVTPGSVRDTLTARFNDLDSVAQLFARTGEDIAAVIVEPVAGNMGVIPPEAGFLSGLRELCSRHRALLIFDEVMTGFRVAYGGAQALFGVTPDITLLGKIIGGGLPVGAFGGRSDIMAMLTPIGSVYQAGTLSGNPVAMTAGLATLRLMTEVEYQGLEEKSQRLEEGLTEAIERVGVTARVQRVGSMVTLFFSRDRVRNFDDARHSDHGRYAYFFRGMLARGVLLPPSGYEACFLSTAHDADTVRFTIEAARVVLGEMTER